MLRSLRYCTNLRQEIIKIGYALKVCQTHKCVKNVECLGKMCYRTALEKAIANDRATLYPAQGRVSQMMDCAFLFLSFLIN